MLELIVHEAAIKDLAAIDKGLRQFFYSHFEKACREDCPRRHLCVGLPYFVEEVTKQARFAYALENTAIRVVRCFATHKEYERWFRLQ